MTSNPISNFEFRISKQIDFYGWPALAIIVLFALFGGLFILLARQSAPRGPLPGTVSIRYAPRNNLATAEDSESAEIRALYASDLFASARGNRFSASPLATNPSNRAPLSPCAPPLLMPQPPTTGKATAAESAARIRVLGNDDLDSPILRRPPRRSAGPSNQTPLVSSVLKGELKPYSIEPAFFHDLGPAGKAWSVQAQIRVNNEGRVEHVLAEPQDCPPELQREIIRRLYQYRFSNVSKACRGAIIISYPVYQTRPE